ncbi:cytochrome d ubiquinol oxidase subunit II [Actinospica sp. MGRD01-02]|uniref:Cytochrome d ubiquinol oxidase subunit II n=1 Tax=Actinospica acidithermotolerans TaxID=2828514 RepID=A0A941EH12_9ACTN|nr:cytochrome d ubiquinol oxidase subunit II [Actinospica acidithermotolerans]MBR7830347.1 cytochrome d ubiquinol oxidase subunit II [Actinospica acidithermotolerans]
MVLDLIPLLIALVGLVLYTVLGGADFGAGLWQLLAGSGERGRALRDHAHRANAPVWEANHVWLILVLTVVWTTYPSFFGSVCSTLAIPLFLAAIGIVFRGLTYALHYATDVPRERRVIDVTFSISSILTPFMLGTVVGAIASDRVPVGNAAGNAITSWTNPTSLMSGVLAVCTGAFLSAVYLAADARRFSESGISEAFRTRAVASALITGVLALATLAVAHQDAPRLYDGLTSGLGLAAVVVSGVAGLASLGLVWLRRYTTARLAAAVAVAGLLAGWAAAQRPDLLPGLTVQEAAADNATLIAVIVSIAVGAVILFPSLAFLFRLVLTGRLDPGRLTPASHPVGPDARRPAWAGRAAVACFVLGTALFVFADGDAAHTVAVIAFAVTAVFAYAAIGPDQLAARESEPE